MNDNANSSIVILLHALHGRICVAKANPSNRSTIFLATQNIALFTRSFKKMYNYVHGLDLCSMIFYINKPFPSLSGS